MIEEWLPVKDFPNYEISNFGKVRSLPRSYVRLRNGKPHTVPCGGKIINGWIKYSKYGKPVCINISLRKNRRTYEMRLHRLVLINFIGDCPESMEGCHNDGNPENNRLDNLRWDTHKENSNDMIKHGTRSPTPLLDGVNSGMACFNEDQVNEIRSTPYYSGIYRDLSRKYGTNPETIARLYKGITYKRLKNNMDDLLKLIKLHEGYDPNVYIDSLGFSTIGYGFLVDKRKGCGLYPEESEFILKNRINKIIEIIKNYSWYKNQDSVRQGALIELCYNLGLNGLLSFKNTLKSINEKDYESAANHLLDSKWARQVGPTRSNNIAQRIRTGRY